MNKNNRQLDGDSNGKLRTVDRQMKYHSFHLEKMSWKSQARREVLQSTEDLEQPRTKRWYIKLSGGLKRSGDHPVEFTERGHNRTFYSPRPWGETHFSSCEE